MIETTNRHVQRNWDEAERERHGQQVKERFASERQDKFRKIQDTIQVMLAQGVTISQNEVARVAGVSVGFINKHLRDVVEKAKQRQQESAGTLHTVRQLSTDTKEIERLKLLNQRLRESFVEQRRCNKELLAQVSQIVDLEDDVERLRTENRELSATFKAYKEKVISLPVVQNLPQIEAAIASTGIKLNSTLRQEINRHSPEAVLKAIAAFEQYRSKHKIKDPPAFLLKAIKEEWEPNVVDEAVITNQCQVEDKKNIQAHNNDRATNANTSSSQASELELLKANIKELQTRLLGVESLESENEKLVRENNHLKKLLVQSQAESRSKGTADFAKARETSKEQPDFVEVEF